MFSYACHLLLPKAICHFQGHHFCRRSLPPIKLATRCLVLLPATLAVSNPMWMTVDRQSEEKTEGKFYVLYQTNLFVCWGVCPMVASSKMGTVICHTLLTPPANEDCLVTIWDAYLSVSFRVLPYQGCFLGIVKVIMEKSMKYQTTNKTKNKCNLRNRLGRYEFQKSTNLTIRVS